MVSPGLNLLAKCRTEGCPAFKDFVYVKKGFGTFNIAK
jgi:hypothetical protein